MEISHYVREARISISKIEKKIIADTSWYKSIPDYIASNIRREFPLRDYQRNAIRNFISFYEDPSLKTSPTHVLFQMATGSGKHC